MKLITTLHSHKCPYCQGNARIVESEMTTSIINNDGYLEARGNASYRCGAYCNTCKKPLFVDPTDNYRILPLDAGYIRLHYLFKK